MVRHITRASRPHLRFESLEYRRLLANSAELIISGYESDGTYYECSQESCPNFEFESKVPRSGLNLGLRNFSNVDARRIVYSVSGDDVPEAIQVGHCGRNRILAGTACGFAIWFHPPDDDPVGTSYTATYTVTGQNFDSLTMVVVCTKIANDAPQADAGLGYTGDEDQAILFDASASVDYDGDPLTYEWDFGDGTTAATSQPTIEHEYAWGDTFTVGLTVSDGIDSDVASTTATIAEVNDVPIVDAGGTYHSALGESVTFDASATTDFDNQDGSTSNDQPLQYTWDFGDGNDVTTAAVTIDHTYAAEGSYDVTLTVSDGVDSVATSTTATITIGPAGDDNDIYVWDIDFDSKRRGKHTDYRVVIDVNRDSDADGAASTIDASAPGVSVTVELRDVSGNLVGTYTGTTGSDGVFRSNWIQGLSSGSYTAEVVDMAHASFAWNPLLDPTANDLDTDGDGLPEEILVV